MPLLATVNASGWIHSPVVVGNGDFWGNRLSIIIHVESQAMNSGNVFIEIIHMIKDAFRSSFNFLVAAGAAVHGDDENTLSSG